MPQCSLPDQSQLSEKLKCSKWWENTLNKQVHKVQSPVARKHGAP